MRVTAGRGGVLHGVGRAPKVLEQVRDSRTRGSRAAARRRARRLRRVWFRTRAANHRIARLGVMSRPAQIPSRCRVTAARVPVVRAIPRDRPGGPRARASRRWGARRDGRRAAKRDRPLRRSPRTAGAAGQFSQARGQASQFVEVAKVAPEHDDPAGDRRRNRAPMREQDHGRHADHHAAGKCHAERPCGAGRCRRAVSCQPRRHAVDARRASGYAGPM